MLNIGCHLSISKGYYNMGKTIDELGGNTFQFFTRNPRGGKTKDLDLDDVNDLKLFMIENNFAPILAHGAYTMNLAANKEETYEFAKMVFKDDLERLEKLPCNLYNFHPGSHTGRGIEWGMERILKAINEIITPQITTCILFETMAGKGSEIGSDFKELKYMLDNVKYPEKFGVCFDTCHVFERGYDIKNNLDEVLDEFDSIIGLKKIKAIHLNDSKNDLGARKDRHERIGEGGLGLEAILKIVTSERLKNIPLILETPNEIEGYREEIRLIKEIING